MKKVMKFVKCLIVVGVIITNQFVLLSGTATVLHKQSIGLLVMATGKYIGFVPQLLDSARKYFCVHHEVSYFIFTDDTHFSPLDDTTVIYQQRLGWPYDTLKRFHVYLRNVRCFEHMDYVFACDADMLFVDHFGDEIFGDRVAVIHAGFINQRGTYETNSFSTACVASTEGEHYFAGGFYGGAVPEFMRIIKTCAERVDADLAKNYVAIWHDESQLNRFFIDFKPTIMLEPAYCAPQDPKHIVRKKLIALDKNHKEVRE